MAVTVRGTDILFNDATTQTTAYTGVPSAYGVGAYVVAAKTTSGGSNTTAGETIAGSSLRVSTSGGTPSANTLNPVNFYTHSTASYNLSLSGTWRAQQAAGNGNSVYGDSNYYITTLWVRIS